MIPYYSKQLVFCAYDGSKVSLKPCICESTSHASACDENCDFAERQKEYDHVLSLAKREAEGRPIEDQERVLKLLRSKTAFVDWGNLEIPDTIYDVELGEMEEVKQVEANNVWSDCPAGHYEYTLQRYPNSCRTLMRFSDLPKQSCGQCGKELTLVRPGKYQCDNPECEPNEKKTELKFNERRNEKGYIVTDLTQSTEIINDREVPVGVGEPEKESQQNLIMQILNVYAKYGPFQVEEQFTITRKS